MSEVTKEQAKKAVDAIADLVGTRDFLDVDQITLFKAMSEIFYSEAGLQKGFMDLAYDDLDTALPLITGLFVGLHIANAEIITGNDCKNISIDINGCGSRNITIHAP